MGLFSFLERRISMAEYAKEFETVASNFAGQIYFKRLAWYIAKSIVAGTISKCEFKTYEKGKEVQNELYYKLNVNPNPNQNSSEFLYKFVDQLYDNGQALIVKNNEHLYVADSFGIDKQPLREDIFSAIVVEEQSMRGKRKANDVFYLRFKEGQHVKPMIDGAYEQYGAAMQAAIEKFKRDCGKKYKLKMDSYRAGDEAFQREFETVVKRQLEVFMNNDKAVYPQFRGYDLEELNNNIRTTAGTSSDIIALRKEVFDTVAQAFKIPVSLMYGNMTNLNDVMNVLLTFCIDPLAEMISEEFTRKTCTFEEWKSGTCVHVDTSCIKHIDILEMAANIDKLISSGLLSIDETRSHIRKAPIGDEFGTRHWMTKNYMTDEEALNPKPEPQPVPPQFEQPEEPTEPEEENEAEEVNEE